MAKKKKEENAPVQELFSRFGEFDSVEELNKTAEGLKEEKDFDSLKELAEENGIEKCDVDDYINGITQELAVQITAAMGRLKVELASLDGQAGEMCKFYAKFAEEIAIGRKDVAAGIMKKGARIKGIYDQLYQYASKHKSGGCFCGSTTDVQDEELVIAHYTGGDITKLFEKWFQ